MLRLLAILTALCLSVGGTPARAQDEPQTFNAFAVVGGNGGMVKSGDKQSVMVALLSGAFFVETGEGPVHAGQIACPGMVRIDLETKQQTANGACTFTAIDGATSYGEWDCTGYNLVGCRGTFKLTGGTGRLAGITGGAILIWRPSSSEFKTQPDGSTVQNATGILVFQEFKISKK